MLNKLFPDDDVKMNCDFQGFDIFVKRIREWQKSCSALFCAAASIDSPELEDEVRQMPYFKAHRKFLSNADLALKADLRLVTYITQFIADISTLSPPFEKFTMDEEVFGEVYQVVKEDDFRVWAFKRCITHTEFFTATVSELDDIDDAFEAYAHRVFSDMLAQTVNVLAEQDAP